MDKIRELEGKILDIKLEVDYTLADTPKDTFKHLLLTRAHYTLQLAQDNLREATKERKDRGE